MSDSDPLARYHRHMDEVIQFTRNQLPKVAPDEAHDMTDGFLSAIGFHEHLQVVYDEEQEVYRLPWLDKYWTRAGCHYLEPHEMEIFDVRRFSSRIWYSIKEADRRNELRRLIDVKRISNLRALVERAI